MRYLFAPLGAAGPRIGVGWHREYANIGNAIRFGLAFDTVAPGQYAIFEDPRGSRTPYGERPYTTAYKRVTA